MKTTKRFQQIAIIVMIIAEIIIGCYMNQVRGLVNDEIFSLGLANSTADYIFFGNDQIESNANDAGWFSGECFRDYVTVQPGEQWAVKNVFANQGRDNHPPLFYLWVNMVSSFTPNELNLLGAAFINILSMCGVIVLLYLSTRLLAGNTWYSVVPSFLWLLSTACKQLTNYIRMYTLLCFFVMVMVYLHICFINEEKISKKRAIQLAVTVCLGGLTHYYFYIFNFFLAFWFVVLYIIKWRKELKQKYKGLIPFVSAYVVGGMSALVIFPKVISHVTKSDMSQKMQNTAKSNEFPLNETFQVINDNIFQGKFIWIAVLAIIIVVISIVLYRTQMNKENVAIENMETNISKNKYIEICALLLISSACFALFVTKSALYIAWYYVSPAFEPLLLLVIIVGLPGYMIKKKSLSSIYCLALCAISLFLFVTNRIPGMIETRKEDMAYQTMINSFEGKDCIYMSESWNVLYGNHLQDMRSMDEVRCITPEQYNTTDLTQLLAGRETTEQDIVMIFRKVEDVEIYVKQMEQTTGTSGKLQYETDKESFYTFE